MNILLRYINYALFVILTVTVLPACSVSQTPSQKHAVKEPSTSPSEYTVDKPGLLKPARFEVLSVEKTYTKFTDTEYSKSPHSTGARFTGVLRSHNRVRAKHRLPPLKWSDKLAAYSQQWVDRLGQGSRCKMRHRGGTPPYGENLYWSSPTVWTDGDTEVARETNRITIREVVKAWTDEERWYDYNRNSCQPGRRCGHYTQVVWRDTTEVGCAMKVCADKSQTWVCSYNPPGNYKGIRPY